MLLRHTNDKPVERKALTVNPAKTCQPVGAMYAALGVHKCLPHSHGSQGCCSYHRSALTRHYKEPVMATTSSFTEGASVFGGQANIIEAITNVFNLYDPDVIAVHTTCLSEVIGDDMTQIINKAEVEGKIPAGKKVIHASTPSFKGSHVVGYSSMVASFIQKFATTTGKKSKTVNILPSFVEPSDMSEIKRIAEAMGASYVMLPDTSDVVNGPMDGKFRMYPKGGTTLKEIASMGDASKTIALGRAGSMAQAKLLDTKCKVPCEILDLPVGIKATDAFVDALRSAAGVSVPEEILLERGQLLDVMVDMNQYLHGKKVSLVGDPDVLVGIAAFCAENGMRVLHAVSGTAPGPKFERRIKELCGEDVVVKTGAQADMFYFHQLVKSDKPDLVFGNTYCKYIARDEDIPLIRAGFPIYDRVGHSYFPIVGYRGTLRLLERALDAVMDRQDRDAAEEKFELVM
jgi:nitrogenase molybdenum-iron protein beta chain